MKFTPTLKQKYETLWNTMKVQRVAQAQKMAKLVLKGKARYQAVEKITGVPWEFIGLTHYRESTCNFAGVLHNGQHIIGTGKKTTIVPKGRGPFSTWEEAALDALKLRGLDKVQDWSIGHLAYQLEGFNGYGYHNKGINSPYLWGGTNHYSKGKYIRDHVFDPEHVDQQLGVMAILKVLRDGAGVHEHLADAKPPAPSTQKPSRTQTNTPSTLPGKATLSTGLLGVLAALWAGYWWVLPLLGIAALGWYILRRRRKETTPVPQRPTPTVSTDQTSLTPSEAVGNNDVAKEQEVQDTGNTPGDEKPL